MLAQGKTILVTGGGNGIGRELVLNLVGKGARVAALDIRDEGLKQTVALAGSASDRISTHVIDITDREAVAALPEAVIDSHGGVDGLINCAGIVQPFVLFNDLEYAQIERVMNVNFWGTVNMLKAFLPHLLTRPEAHVVDVSSMGGFVPVPGQTIYGASKAAVKLLTEGLHSELADTNVHVTVVFPGAIGTNIAENSGVAAAGGAAAEEAAKKFKPMPPVQAAEIIVDGMEKDAYRVLVGSDAKFMDRYSRFSPKRAAKTIYAQMKSLLAG